MNPLFLNRRLLILLPFLILGFLDLGAQDSFNGNIFLDHNGDGIKNEADFNHPVITIKGYIDSNNNGVYDSNDQLMDQSLSDAQGNYSLDMSLSSSIAKSFLVLSGDDDAEENLSGTVRLNSSDLEMAYEGGTTEQIVGIRFADIALPASSIITNAYIEFESKSGDNSSCNLTILGEKNINSLKFEAVNQNITSRNVTSASINWTPTTWEAGELYSTPNLKNIVQEQINQAGWGENSALTFIISGSGEREARSKNGSGQAPKLYLEYTVSFTGNKYFIILEDTELALGSNITMPSMESYTFDTGLGSVSDVNFGFQGEAVLCYGMSDGSENSGLSALNRITGKNELVGISNVMDIETAAIHPFSTELYAASTNQLGIIDKQTGLFTALKNSFGTGSHSVLSDQAFLDVDGLAFDPINGELWGTNRNDGWDVLLKIDPTTGSYIPNAFGNDDFAQIKDIDGLLPGDIDDIGIDPVSRKMYGIANNTNFDILVEIDKLTGVATMIDTIRKADGSLVKDVEGMSFSNFGVMFAVTGNKSSINNSQWIIDPATAVATFVGIYEYGTDYESCGCLTGAPNNLSGVVYNDKNGNEVLDAGENGLENVTIFLYFDNNNNREIDLNDILVDSILTDATGAWEYMTGSNENFLFMVDLEDLPSEHSLTTDNLEMADLETKFGGVTDANNNFGYAAASTLPVSLVHFSAEKVEHIIELSWVTETEINNHGFEIQRSVSGFDWETIGFVYGAGQSNAEVNYSFFDRNPSDGLNYYRLKQIDFDENFEYSSIESIKININKRKPLVLFPNPVSTVLHVSNASGNGKIYNILGELIQEVSFTDQTTKMIDVSNYAKGIYHLVLTDKYGERRIEKFIK